VYLSLIDALLYYQQFRDHGQGPEHGQYGDLAKGRLSTFWGVPGTSKSGEGHDAARVAKSKSTRSADAKMVNQGAKGL
jgi:hypothetical protein